MTSFTYTFKSIELTVDVEFDYGIMYHYFDRGGYEVYVDLIEINKVMCGELDMTPLFENGAYCKVSAELERACADYATSITDLHLF